MEREFFPLLLERGVRFFGFVSPGYWVDIGTPAKYFQAQQDLLAGRFRAHVAPRGREGPEGWIHPDRDHRRHRRGSGGPWRSAPNCQIEAGAAVGPSVVLGAGMPHRRRRAARHGGALGGGRGGHGGPAHGVSRRAGRVDRRPHPRHARRGPGRRHAPRRLFPPRRGPLSAAEVQAPRIRFGTDGWRGVIADDFTEANAATVVQAAATAWAEEAGGHARPARRGLRHPLQLPRGRASRRGHPRGQRLARAPGRPAGADARRVLQRHRPRGGRRPRRDGEPQPGPLQRDQAQGRVRRLRRRRSSPGAWRRRSAAPRRAGCRPRAAAASRRWTSCPTTSSACGAASPWTARRRGPSASWPTPSTARPNGLMKELVPAAWGEVRILHGAPDPLFGGLHPEPIPPHLDQLAAEVRASGADIGVAMDGDGDRLGAVTGAGALRDAARGPHAPRPPPRPGPRVAGRGREGLRDGRAGRSAVRAARDHAPRHAHRIQAHREPHADP